MKFTFLYFLTFLLGNNLFSQNRNFSFHRFGAEEGLSNTNIFAIKQDKNNLIYLATDNGVYNFDGYTFNELKPKTALKSNDIRNLSFTDNNNLIIINRRQGIYEYNQQQNDVAKIAAYNFKKSVDELIVTDKFVYSLTDQISINSIELSTHKNSDDNIKKQNNTNQAYAIYKTKAGVVYVGRSDGLYELKNGIQTKIKSVKNTAVYSICETKTNDILIGSDDFIYVLHDLKIIKTISVSIKKQTSVFNLNNGLRVSKLIADKYGRIWFSSFPDDNLYLVENEKIYDVFELLSTDKVLINCLFKDVDDNIWLGTFNDGVYLIHNPSFKNISFYSNRKNLQVLNALFIDNNIAVGTENGLYAYDIKNFNTQTIVTPDDFFGEKINGIYNVDNNVIYAKNSSFNNTKKSVLINDKPIVFSPTAAKLFYKTANEYYMADALGNLYLIKNNLNETALITDTLISFPDYRTKISALKKTETDLLVGTSDGLTIYNFKTKKHKNYRHPFLANAINDIVQFNNKTYLATDNGITVLNDTTNKQYVGEQKLSVIKKIRCFKNKIWLATNDGLIVCDWQFNPITIFNKTNGLLSNIINDVVFSNDSTCCICTNKGITLCSINELINKPLASNKLFISKIFINDSLVNATNNTVLLNSSQTDIIIYFKSPLYIKPNKQLYRYKFDNGKWLSLENTQIRLTSINGGKHKVEITNSIDGINWSSPIALSIIKKIPFTQSGWFIVCILLAGLTLILSSLYFIFKRLKTKTTKKIEEDRQVNLLKHQAMNSLMSPHFIFNSLTSIQNYINLNDSLKASEYLAKFSRLIRMIIEKAAQGEITLHEELTRLNYYLDLEKERFKGKFDFKLVVNDNVNTFDIKIPNMIIQPYAENSIIHGILPKHEHGTLTISFKKISDSVLTIVIDDDGIGFNKAKENAKAGHKSLGTKTIENILELNTKLTGKKQSVSIIDKSDMDVTKFGTEITITLQLN